MTWVLCMHIYSTSSWTCIRYQWDLNPWCTRTHVNNDEYFKSIPFPHRHAREFNETSVHGALGCMPTRIDLSKTSIELHIQKSICCMSGIESWSNSTGNGWRVNMNAHSSWWNLNSWHTWIHARKESPSNEIPFSYGHALEINGTSIHSKLGWHLQCMAEEKRKEKSLMIIEQRIGRLIWVSHVQEGF